MEIADISNMIVERLKGYAPLGLSPDRINLQTRPNGEERQAFYADGGVFVSYNGSDPSPILFAHKLPLSRMPSWAVSVGVKWSNYENIQQELLDMIDHVIDAIHSAPFGDITLYYNGDRQRITGESGAVWYDVIFRTDAVLTGKRNEV